MTKDWMLSLGISVITIITALALIRWYAPQLLGINSDLRMVRVSEEMPAFYDNIFREEDITSKDFILSDPVIVNRAKPLYPDVGSTGPHDILGFRNKTVPNIADIITIGDSQTYGINASVTNNWPGHLKNMLGQDLDNVVYNMSVGAWGGTNYLEILKKAVYLQPRIVIVAFYTGNDPLSDFRNVYTYDKWADLRPTPDLGLNDLPEIVYPPPTSELLPVLYDDGTGSIFTPEYRYISNQFDNVVVRAAYLIMAGTAVKMRDIAVKNNIEIYFTIIPTKELVYAKKTALNNFKIPERVIKEFNIDQNQIDVLKNSYSKLVNDEKKNIEELASFLNHLEKANYIDLVDELQNAALKQVQIYPADDDGHPFSIGYEVIANTIHANLNHKLIEKIPYGIVGRLNKHEVTDLSLYSDRGVEKFINIETAIANGWKKEDVLLLPYRDMSRLNKSVINIRTKQPEKFGPEYIKKSGQVD